MRKLAFLLLLVTGCATPTNNYRPTIDEFSVPPIGVSSVASVGDELLSQGRLTETEGLVLEAPVKVSAYTLTSGFYPKSGQKNESQFFGFLPMPMTMPNGVQMGALQRGVLADPPISVEVIDGENKICVVTAFNLHTCRKGHAYRFETATSLGDASFRQTLIYNGRVGDKINIGYREYSDSMVRPAFSNEVEYDMSVSKTFSYKGATIEVIDADNRQITYVVRSNFRQVK